MALGGGCAPNNVPPGCVSFGALPNATAQGLVAPGTIDTALARVLRARFRLGLMDPPDVNPYTRIASTVVDSPAHRVLALRAARASVVLLKRGVLPLRRSTTGHVDTPGGHSARAGVPLTFAVGIECCSC